MSKEPREIEFFELLEAIWSKKFTILSLSIVLVYFHIFFHLHIQLYTLQMRN